MSDQSNIAKFALNDILMGIAQGLNDAQQQLKNQSPYDEYGRPNTIYHLPYLDFQLQVTSEYEEITTGTNPATGNAYPVMPVNFSPAPKGSFKYSAASTSSNKTNVGMMSTISGRFVATVPNEGVPQIVLLTKTSAPVAAGTYYNIELEVVLSNVVGEKLANSTIEFNFDSQLTRSMNTGTYTDPTFSVNEVSTDANGVAKTTVKVTKRDYDLATPVRFIILVTAGTLQKNISICKN